MRIAILFAFLGLAATSPETDGAYRLVQVKGPVSLYERWVEITPGNKVREMKAEFVVDATPEEAFDLLRDPARSLKWRISLDKFEFVETNGEKGWVTYARYRTPWPLDNRDMVFCYEAKETNGSYFATFQSCTHPSFPLLETTTRVEGVQGTWTFQPKGTGKALATYTAISSQKIYLPRRLTDPIFQNNLLDTLNRFCEVLKG